MNYNSIGHFIHLEDCLRSSQISIDSASPRSPWCAQPDTKCRVGIIKSKERHPDCVRLLAFAQILHPKL